MRWDPQKSCVIDGEIFLPLNFPSVIYLSSFCGFTWATYEIYSSIGTNSGLLWLSVSTELRWYSLMRVPTLADNHYYFCFSCSNFPIQPGPVVNLIVCYVNRKFFFKIIYLGFYSFFLGFCSFQKHETHLQNTPPYSILKALQYFALSFQKHLIFDLCPQQQRPPS